MALKRDRFHHLLPEEKLAGKKVMIVGVGGIGGYLANLLAKMGVEHLTLVDFDLVEEVNVATQVHSDRNLGWLKVEAVREQVYNINPEARVDALADKFDGAMLLDRHQVVVTALDSLEVRKQVVQAWLNTHDVLRYNLLVDPRMALEACEVNLFCGIDTVKDEFQRYLKSLEDTDSVDLPCGAKAVAYTGSFAATLAAAQIRRFLQGHRVPYYIAANVGSGRVESEWLEGQKYVPDLLGEGDALAQTV